MKKITIGLMLLVAGNNAVFSQDFKKVKNPLTIFLTLGGDAKLEEAKTEVDKLMADPKAQGKAEAYLLKTEVYGSIASGDALKTKYPLAGQEALPSLKKYLELEPDFAKYKEDNYAGVNGIYTSFYNEGIKNYNVKNWDSAYSSFKGVVDVSDIMIKNKWTAVTFDTTAYLFAGITSQNANKEEESLKYYEKLASLKVKGKDYEHIYVFLPQYYSKKKDEAQFKRVLALGKEVYPEKTFWNDLEFEYITNNLSLSEISKKFDEQLAANQLKADNAMDFGNFFFNDKKIKDLKPEERKPYTDRAVQSFNKALELDPKNVLASYNVAVSAYVIWEDAADAATAIKGITADIKTRRAQADKVAMSAGDKAVDALEKAYKMLDEKADKSKVEKNSQSSTAKFLANLYSWKRDKSKGKAAEYDMYDKKMQFYDKKY